MLLHFSIGLDPAAATVADVVVVGVVVADVVVVDVVADVVVVDVVADVVVVVIDDVAA